MPGFALRQDGALDYGSVGCAPSLEGLWRARAMAVATLASLMNERQPERQKHLDAIAVIEEQFEELGRNKI